MELDFNYEDIVLDLYDVALLLNYERATTEPRFRHAKLREVATGGAYFQTIRCTDPAWTEAVVPKTGLVFDISKESGFSKAEKDEPDLPSNMIPRIVSSPLRTLSSKDLELYYWQSRNHDGCYTTVTIFQHFMEFFPLELTRIRVKVVENNKPRKYTTLADDRMIVEIMLYEPRSMNVSVVHNNRPILYTTGESANMRHAVLSFPPPTLNNNRECILDLSSLKFGDAGRGFKGRGTFVLEPVKDYLARLDIIAVRNNFQDAERTQCVRPRASANDEFLVDVAKRAKARWEKRKTDPWCGHCGAPSRIAPLKRCAKCHVAHYCNAEHQLAAWPYHKHFCPDSETAKKELP